MKSKLFIAALFIICIVAVLCIAVSAIDIGIDDSTLGMPTCGCGDYTFSMNYVDEYYCRMVSYCTVCHTSYYGNSVRHDIGDDGNCVNCGSACEHVSYKMVSSPYDSSVHKMVYLCNDCGVEFRYVYVEHSYDPSTCLCSCGTPNHSYHDIVEDASAVSHHLVTICKRCGYIRDDAEISHDISYTDFYIEYSYVSLDEHELHYVCEVCDTPFDSEVRPHTFQNGGTTCAGCGYGCDHPSYTGIVCDVCGYECAHPYRSERLTNIGNNQHLDETVCDDCGTVTYSKTFDCEYVNSSGLDSISLCPCYGRCQHDYSHGTCTRCGYSCAHNYVLTDPSDGKYYLDCTVCDLAPYTFIDPDVNFFKRPLYKSAWNDKLGSLEWSFDASGKIDAIWQRFENADYSYYSNATFCLYGSFQFPDLYGARNGRYVVMQLRYSDVNYLELDLWSSDDYNGTDRVASTDCSSFRPIYFKYLPENEWLNVVIDLASFTPKNTTAYDLGDSSVQEYLRALLCAYFTSPEGYIDVGYFAICNDLVEADRVISLSYGYDFADESYYYLGDKGFYFEERDTAHTFDGNACTSCGYECQHEDSYVLYKSYSDVCGYYDVCDLCGEICGWHFGKHAFNDNGVECTKKNCDYKCFHNYVNGHCTLCKWTCTHNYEGGHILCVSCGKYHEGITIQDDTGFIKLMSAIYDAQANTFSSMLSYDILGVNVASLILSLIALGVSIFFDQEGG